MEKRLENGAGGEELADHSPGVLGQKGRPHTLACGLDSYGKYVDESDSAMV